MSEPSKAVVKQLLQWHGNGDRIIATWINDSIPSSIAVRLETEPPPPDTSLLQCQRSLSNLFQGIRQTVLPDLVPDEEIFPWVVGRGRDDRWIGISLRQSTETYWDEKAGRSIAVDFDCHWQEEVRRLVLTLSETCKNDEAKLRESLIAPVEQHRAAFRDWVTGRTQWTPRKGAVSEEVVALLDKGITDKDTILSRISKPTSAANMRQIESRYRKANRSSQT